LYSQLEQPILKSLSASAENTWIYQLLITFNNGDVDLFEKQGVEYGQLLNNQVKNYFYLFKMIFSRNF